jgi:hypothetical protein
VVTDWLQQEILPPSKSAADKQWRKLIAVLRSGELWRQERTMANAIIVGYGR